MIGTGFSVAAVVVVTVIGTGVEDTALESSSSVMVWSFLLVLMNR